MAKPAPLTADAVLVSYEGDESSLLQLVLDVGAHPEELASLPDEPSRCHWSAAYVAETMNTLEAEGVSLTTWVRAISMSRRVHRATPEPIAGAAAGLL